MAPHIFDTHKAVKALQTAGFTDHQAEAVVETVGTAMGENLATKADLEIALQPMVTKADLDAALDAALEPMVSKADLEIALQPMVTKADLDAALDAALEPMVSKAELEIALQPMVTKADLNAALEPMVSKAELEMALQPIKAELVALEQRMTIKLGAFVAAGVGFLAVFEKVF